LHTDPKTLWARQHPERFPVEVNKARLHELLRVPGIVASTAAQGTIGSMTYTYGWDEV